MRIRMTPRTLILAGVTVLVVVLAFFTLGTIEIVRPPEAVPEPAYTALVATQNLARGSLIPAEALMLVPFPEAGMLASIDTAVGRYATRSLARGQYLTAVDVTSVEESQFIHDVRASYGQ